MTDTFILIIAFLLIVAIIACHICYVAGEAKGFNECWHYIKDEHKRSRKEGRKP